MVYARPRRTARRLISVSAGNDGISIIEVLIGAVLVLIAAIGTALMFSTGQAYVQSEGDNRVAVLLAQQRLEQIRSAGFGSTSSTGATLPSLCPVTPAERCETNIDLATENFPGYRRTTTVTAICPNNFTTSMTTTVACPGGATVEAKFFSVTVTPSEGTSATADRKAQPVTLTMIMVSH